MNSPRTHLLRSVLIGLSTCAALPVSAHHSFASFDMDKTLSVTGTVKEFQWTNPHSWIILLAAGPNGAASTEWRLEGAPPVNLVRGGWTEDTLNEGDKVTVTYHPRKDGARGGSWQVVTLPNGKQMGMMGPQPGGPPGGSSGGGK